MKAWYVSVFYADAGDIVYADTRGKARQKGLAVLEGESFLDVRVRRVPAVDGEPHKLTVQEWLDLGYSYECMGCGGFLDQGYITINGDGYHLGCRPRRLA